MVAVPPRPARDAPSDLLLELVGHLRRELAQRGESLSPDWVDQAVADLRSGDLEGWWLGSAAGPGGLAFFSVRPQRAYGHVHVEPGEKAADRSLALYTAMVDALPMSVHRLDCGLTGLSLDDEATVRPRFAHVPGTRVIPRFALERPLRPDDAREPHLPDGVRRIPLADVALDALATLDRRAFGATSDAALLADTLEENRRVLEEIQHGRLGLFLEAASTALASDDGHLIAALLTTEETPRRGIFVDLAVAPEFQRRGLATYLLHLGFRALLALGYASASLWVSESNAPARALYAKEGFRPYLASTLIAYTRAEPPQPHTSR